MKLKSSFLILVLAAVAVYGIWWFSDIGREYESISFHSKSSFLKKENGEIEIIPSSNYVIKYTVGCKPSRTTTAHGYWDHIYIEFKKLPESTFESCEIVQAARTGYRRVGSYGYGIESIDHVLLKIRSSDDKIHIEGAIKITKLDDGKYVKNAWELVYISPREISV